MATFAQLTDSRTLPSARRNPLIVPLMLWHLLSLDGPSVAALWTWFLARASLIRLPLSSVLAMFLAVWLLYAADRLLDTRDSAPERPHAQPRLEERHRFHRLHHRAFIAGIVLVSLVLAALLPRLPPPALRLYALLGAVLFAYFLWIHSAAPHSLRLAKEIAVGIFFAAATLIPAAVRQPGLRVTLLPAAFLFAILCTLNCLFIRAWEHPADPEIGSEVRLLFTLTAVALLGSFALAIFDRRLPWQLPAACGLASALLFLLHLGRKRLARITLRAAADLCLLTPLLLWPFLPR